MATKIDQSKITQTANQESSDLEILFPDREIVIAGKVLNVRELRFAEQLKWQPILNELAETLEEVNMDDVNFIDHVLARLGLHIDKLLDVVAFCCDQPRDWIESLPASSGEELIITWWTVNSSFFARRLLRKKLVKALSEVTVGMQAHSGEESSLNLFTQDMIKKV